MPASRTAAVDFRSALGDQAPRIGLDSDPAPGLDDPEKLPKGHRCPAHVALAVAVAGALLSDEAPSTEAFPSFCEGGSPCTHLCTVCVDSSHAPTCVGKHWQGMRSGRPIQQA
ncbi:hypothetical protein EXIGLDRAFT_736074 [Exidia glandulosa HHB12029]|uniref:Uncharacterized protein n=1 Tax=Exidia glandulosa HHB12029 TaxID=1314781 RepID=A0A165JL64_EXIGL|nr:hypothetical protein EXIGLDRAFT_736074 [Exidia glandulosa HHB12029]